MATFRRSQASSLRAPLAGLALFSASLSLAALAPSGALFAQGDARSLLDQGISLYEEGNLDGAKTAFEQAFALDPAAPAVADWVKTVTARKVLSMLGSGDPALAGMARQILQASRATNRKKADDTAALKQAVHEVLHGSPEERLLLKIRHAGEYGRNLVPHLVNELGNASVERRAVAINWIADLGRDAVPVLQAASRHPDGLVRTGVAQLLGVKGLRHPVSFATLKAMIETDEVTEVREAAQVSFSAIQADQGSAVRDRPAKEYYVQNAYNYYNHPHRYPFNRGSYAARVYHLEGSEIVGEGIAPFQLGERMAQQALQDALELDPGFTLARVLSVCNDAAQVAEYDANREHYRRNESSQEELENLLDGQESYVDSVLRLRILAAPSRVLYAGLSRALEDNRMDVARYIVDAIDATHRGGQVPKALLAALAHPESRLVRVAAATAIANWRSLESFEGGEAVVKTLSSAVLSSGVRTVQRIMGDSRRANRFAGLLNDLNVETYTPVASMEAGLDAVLNSPPDLVLVDQDISRTVGSAEVGAVNFLVNGLRRSYRTANVPVVVVVPPDRLSNAKDLYESQERKVSVIADSIDAQGFRKRVLEELFAESEDAKAQATVYAVRAAHALERLSMIPCGVSADGSVEALVQVLGNRPDSVRLPCIRALGNLRAGAAAGELAAVVEQTENEKEIRVAAMTALGQVLEGNSASEVVTSIIQAGMADSDLDLRRAAWFASSNAGLSDLDRLEILRAQPSTGGGEEAGEEMDEPADGDELLDGDLDF